MKKLFLLLAIFIDALAGYAQTSTGGPDSYGYTWRTSADPNGPVYSWIDIASDPGAYIVNGLADDNSVGPFPIGFMFDYYGTLYNSFMVCSNGCIRLGNAQGAAVLASPFPTIPNPSNVNAFIAPMATDLVFDTSTAFASVFYWTSPGNDSLIVSWISAPFWSNSGPGYAGENTFQLILEKNTNRITFQYLTQTGAATQTQGYVTVGIESPTGLSGLNPLYDTYPLPGTAIRFDSGEYNKVKGHVFVDLNSNGVQDVSEPNLTGKLLTNIQNLTYAITDVNGDYTFSVPDTSAYAIYPPAFPHYSAVPASYSGFMNGPNQVDSLNDFMYQPDSLFDDLSVRIYRGGPFRPGFSSGYFMAYANKGTTTLSPQLVLHYPAGLTYLSSSVVPAWVSPDSIVLNLPPLPPLQSGVVQVTFTVDSLLAIGTTLTASAQIFPLANEATPADNTDSVLVTVTGSFDPNDISVDRLSISTDSIQTPPALTYLIRFQNTGNDTAFNVYVVNALSTALDISSFEMLGASHPHQLRLDALSRRLIVDFPAIQLPDSNLNEPASHGYLLYRIRPLNTLLLNDTIPNNAAIYFDFNAPVLTNTALTVITAPVTISVEEATAPNTRWNVYPNPAGEVLHFRSTGSDHSPAVCHFYDLQGRQLIPPVHIAGAEGNAMVTIREIPAGVCILELTDSYGSTFLKVVKQ